MSIFTRGSKPNEKVEDPTKLNQQEIEFLLNTLKTTTLVGEQVEMFYTMVWKLQEQYLQLQDKK
jgi:hypothetical protein